MKRFIHTLSASEIQWFGWFFFYVHNEWAKKSRITKIKRTTNNLEINVCVWVYMVLLHMCLQFRYGTYTYGAISTFNKSSSYRLIAFIIGWTKKKYFVKKKNRIFPSIAPNAITRFYFVRIFLACSLCQQQCFPFTFFFSYEDIVFNWYPEERWKERDI